MRSTTSITGGKFKSEKQGKYSYTLSDVVNDPKLINLATDPVLKYASLLMKYKRISINRMG